MNLIDLSISIVNTSNWAYLEPCIIAIIDTTHKITYEILVVDNVSTDGSVDKIRENFPEVILTVNEKRYGFAKNNNINLRKSSGRYLMLLNDDTLVQPESLETAVKFLDDHPEVGIVGNRMISPDGSFQVASARKFRTLLSEFLIETGLYRKPTHISPTPIGSEDYVEIDMPSEAGMILRREAVEQVGLLDEQFFMFGEGADWCKRVKKAGWKVIYLPYSSIIHFGGVTNKRTSLKMYIQFYKSTYLFFRKDNFLYGAIYRLFLIFIFSIKRTRTLLYLRLKTQDSNNEHYERLNYYDGLLEYLIKKFKQADYPFPVN